MAKTKLKHISIGLFTIALLSSCHVNRLQMSAIAYQSIRSTAQPELTVPNDAKVTMSCEVAADGNVTVYLQNNTNDIILVDRTKSFFRNNDGMSIMFYDPTVRTSTQTIANSGTTGVTANVGAIAGAMGATGKVARALNGINVGSSNTETVVNSNTTYYIDQPQAQIAPHARAAIGCDYNMGGVGVEFLNQAIQQSTSDIFNEFDSNNSYTSFGVYVSYSLDNGSTYEMIDNTIYANSICISNIKEKGKVNNALRDIYRYKNDAVKEDWYLLYFNSNIHAPGTNLNGRLNLFNNFK